jgi:hypothetical protein
VITANSHRAPGRAVAAHEIRVPAAQWYGLGEAGAGGCATERRGGPGRGCTGCCWPSWAPRTFWTSRGRGRLQSHPGDEGWGGHRAVSGGPGQDRHKAPRDRRGLRYPAGHHPDRRQPPRRHPTAPVDGGRAADPRQTRPAAPPATAPVYRPRIPTAASTTWPIATRSAPRRSFRISPGAAPDTAPASASTAGPRKERSLCCAGFAACASAGEISPRQLNLDVCWHSATTCIGTSPTCSIHQRCHPLRWSSRSCCRSSNRGVESGTPNERIRCKLMIMNKPRVSRVARSHSGGSDQGTPRQAPHDHPNHR